MSILLNYSMWSELIMAVVGGSKSTVPVTPPPIIGLANGVAQSIVSLARGFGPLLGGYVSVVSVSRYDQISFLTFPSTDMVRVGTRKPVVLLRRVRDGRCGVFACNRPQLFHPLRCTFSAFWRGMVHTS